MAGRQTGIGIRVDRGAGINDDQSRRLPREWPLGMDGCLFKSILTACVPYVVSTLSSVQALIGAERECENSGETDTTFES